MYGEEKTGRISVRMRRANKGTRRETKRERERLVKEQCGYVKTFKNFMFTEGGCSARGGEGGREVEGRRGGDRGM